MREGLEAVRAARAEGVVVLALSGALGADQLPELDATFARHTADDIVIDLTNCTLASASAIEALDPERWGRPPGSTAAACRRPSARQLIARAGVARRMAVFQCVEDALQCHVLSEAGYGDGWMPTPAPRPVTSLEEYREAPTRYPLHPSRADVSHRTDVRVDGDVPTIAR